MSHKTDMTAKPSRKKIPDHLTAHAAPRQIPAASRHGRHPRRGPSAVTGERSYQATSFSRARSRSATRQASPASTQNIRKMSSRAVRDSTRCRPSSASSSPPRQPRSVERVILRATLARTRMDSVPTRAAAKRQPKGFIPNSHSPAAIIHLPSGGWATKEAQSTGWAHCWKTSRLPAIRRWSATGFFASPSMVRSTPWIISE